MTKMPVKQLKFWVCLLLTCLSLSVAAQTLSSDRTAESGGEENLTDKEQWMKDNYVNEGYIQREYQEECGPDASQEKQQKCRGQEVGGEYAGVDSNTVKMVARIYGTVLGQIDSKIAMKADEATEEGNDEQAPSKEQEGEDNRQEGEDANTDEQTAENGDEGQDGQQDGNNEGDDEDNEEDDNCRYIAMATETLGMVQQQMGQKQIQEGPTQPGNEQRESFYKAAQTHEERAKAAKIQMAGWGATFACYSYYAASGAQLTDWKFILKWSGSGILAHFFKKEKDRHEDYAKEMEKIADDFPGRGDCDPIQERSCYCSQPETQYDPKYCMPQEMQQNGRKLSDEPGELSCIDSNMKADPSCECHATNSCYDQVVQQKLNGLDFGSQLNSGDMDAFGQMMRGKIDPGRVSGAATGQNAIAKKIRPKLSKDNPLNKDPGKINNDQKQQSELLEDYGVPKNIARNIAKRPMSKDAKKELAKLKESGSFQSSSRTASRGSRGSGNQVMQFGGGDGLNKSTSSNDRGREKDNPFKKFMNKGKKKKKNSRNNAEVLNFRGRASQKAQISRKKDYSVFDIISHRYRVSGWKRLDFDQ